MHTYIHIYVCIFIHRTALLPGIRGAHQNVRSSLVIRMRSPRDPAGRGSPKQLECGIRGALGAHTYMHPRKANRYSHPLHDTQRRPT